MTLGLSLSAFTTLHVIISLVGIAAGILLALTMLGRRQGRWRAAYIVTVMFSLWRKRSLSSCL